VDRDRLRKAVATGLRNQGGRALLAADGLYRSGDGGKALEKVLDEKGAPVPRKGG